MKKIVLFLLLCPLYLFSQTVNDKVIFNKYIVGVDNIKSVMEKSKASEWNVSDITHNNNDKYVIITPKKYDQKINEESFTFLFINDVLYCVKYYPNSDKKYNRYCEYLNKKYNVLSNPGVITPYSQREWFNKYVQIDYILEGENSDIDVFIHYDIDMLKNFPQYDNF